MSRKYGIGKQTVGSSHFPVNPSGSVLASTAASLNQMQINIPTNNHMLGILEAESFGPIGSVQQLGFFNNDESPTIKVPNAFVTNQSQKLISKREGTRQAQSRNRSSNHRRLSPFNSFPLQTEVQEY